MMITTGRLSFDSGYTTKVSTDRPSCFTVTHSLCRGDFRSFSFAQSCAETVCAATRIIKIKNVRFISSPLLPLTAITAPPAIPSTIRTTAARIISALPGPQQSPFAPKRKIFRVNKFGWISYFQMVEWLAGVAYALPVSGQDCILGGTPMDSLWQDFN